MRGMFSVRTVHPADGRLLGCLWPRAASRRADMGGSTLRPFVCVGLAYFLIAILVPGIVLRMRRNTAAWTTTGIIWSLIAGTAGASALLG